MATGTGKSGPARGPCVLGQGSRRDSPGACGLQRTQKPHPRPPGATGPRPGPLGEIFSLRTQLAWSADPGHLLKGASVEHTAPGNTSWPWCRPMGLCQWAPMAFPPSLFPCPPSFPACQRDAGTGPQLQVPFTSHVNVCLSVSRRPRIAGCSTRAGGHWLPQPPPPTPVLGLSAKDSRPHGSLTPRQVPAWGRHTRGFRCTRSSSGRTLPASADRARVPGVAGTHRGDSDGLQPGLPPPRRALPWSSSEGQQGQVPPGRGPALETETSTGRAWAAGTGAGRDPPAKGPWAPLGAAS